MATPNFLFQFGNYDLAEDAVRDAFTALNALALENHGIYSIMSIFDDVDVKFHADGHQYSSGDQILYVNYNDLDGRINDSFNANGENHSFSRTIFHELVHGATVSNQSDFAFHLNSRVNFSEAIAIFAENALYAPATNEAERAGHGTWRGPTATTDGTSPEGGGISGTSIFTWMPKEPGETGPMLLSANGPVTFGATSSNGLFSVYKTYVPGNVLRAEIIGSNAAGLIVRNGDSVGYGQGITELADAMMGGKSAAITGAVNLILPTMKNFGIVGNPFGQTVITGLSGERHYTREYTDDTKKETLMYDFIGVGYTIRSGTKSGVVLATESQDLITVGSAEMSASSIILGASGAGYSTSSKDDLIGGSGNDFLISTSLQGGNHLNGGAGNDVLVGPGLSGDVLSGGEGEDLLIGRSKGAFYDGGADSDVLSYYHFGSSSPITLNAGFHAVSSRFGTDNFANIERLIGTPGSDIFNLGADHPVIYGGAGSDTFYGKPAADLLGGSGFDTLDLTGTATPLHTADVMLHSIETIRGSDGNDIFSGINGVIFSGVDSGYTPSIYGGKGDDYVEVRGSINVRGEEGNDTVVIISGGYAVLDGGADYDILDFSRINTTKLTVTLDGASNGTYRVTGGDAHSFKNFEEVKFGSVTLHLHGSGTFTAGTGHNTVYGSNGNDEVTVGGTGGYVRTFDGDDIIHSTGLESVYGEMGNDRLFAGDTVGAKLNGGVYPDQAVTWVNDGDDYLQGGAMADILSGGTGNNELHGGGGYDRFYSGGYGENTVYGEADLGAMYYSFAARGGYPVDPDLISIADMGGWFDVKTTSDHGQTYRTDHLYDIDKVFFEDMTFNLYSGLTYYNPDFLI